MNTLTSLSSHTPVHESSPWGECLRPWRKMVRYRVEEDKGKLERDPRRRPGGAR